MFWEKFNLKSHWVTVIAGVLLILAFYVMLNRQPAEETSIVGYTSDTVKAEVLSILEQGVIQIDNTSQTYQIANLRILEGPFAGQEFLIDYGKRYILSNKYLLSEKDQILVSLTQMPDGTINVFFMDFVRSTPLLALGIVFIVICVLVSGWKGVRSLLGIGLSMLVIIYFIVPKILEGYNPILISLLGSIFFLTITQYLVYGWTLKTHIALGGIMLSIVVTGLIGVFFVNFARLSGMGDENAIYLLQQPGQLNIKNLLIAGIIIGALGILDDLAVGQTSAVIEIYRANPDMSFGERFKRSMNIGKDHIAATVNTLVLAYLGASLSLFLLFSSNNVDLGNVINLNSLAEQIVRSLVGTIGLFIAVPVTTFIACWVVDNNTRLSKLVRVFGPLLNPYEVQQ
jgi:uncharacterized membrane protein